MVSTYARQKSKFFLDSVCVSHVTNVMEQKNVSHDQLVSPTKIPKSKKRERESTTWKPWASPAVAASVAYAPPARVPAQ
jgi:hypothetical protein